MTHMQARNGTMLIEHCEGFAKQFRVIYCFHVVLWTRLSRIHLDVGGGFA